MTKDETRDLRSFIYFELMSNAETFDCGSEDDSRRVAYAVDWIIAECDDEHQDRDWRTLDASDVRELASEAFEAWNGGAR
jgi:hypothetical protein|tara:strand:+ start:197 stop:436 length:240 start_codon:yes stop_codon:yes gene_type:complete